MTRAAQRVLDEALGLTSDERAFLVRELIARLDGEPYPPDKPRLALGEGARGDGFYFFTFGIPSAPDLTGRLNSKLSLSSLERHAPGARMTWQPGYERNVEQMPAARRLGLWGLGMWLSQLASGPAHLVPP
jgi:hypothetical protein